MLKVFIGYDSRMPVLYNVAQHSVQTNCSVPVSITPLNRKHLKGILTRPSDPLQSTEFSFSRFLVPYLSDYKGWSLFMDNDMVVMDDIKKVFDLADDRYSVMCTKHKHVPTNSTKFLGAPQTSYEKKNWSSFMLFNNAKCTILDPCRVDTLSGLELHQFKWLNSDDDIGEIPLSWNHLVGVQEEAFAHNYHYTNGGPYFKKECPQPWWWMSSFIDANDSADQDVFDLAKKAEEYRHD